MSKRGAIMPTTPEDTELLNILCSHQLKVGSLNLGQYKSEYSCICGFTFTTDGHDVNDDSAYTKQKRHEMHLITLHTQKAVRLAVRKAHQDTRDIMDTLISSTAKRARIDELHLSEQGTDTEVSGITKAEYYSRRYKELTLTNPTEGETNE